MMNYETPAALRAALEQRLLTASRQGGGSLGRLRKLVVFERLLARLLIVAPDRWVMKGGLALDFRLGNRARATKDLDLASRVDEETATTDLLAAQWTGADDYFAFVVERTGRLDAAQEGAAVRYRVTAQLAGRRFEEVLVDVGFGDPPVLHPEYLDGPGLLGFAGLAPIRVPALPLEQHVAEKVHAYTRLYEGQRRSSRVKDLIDLVLIPSAAAFEAGRLRWALRATFDTRDTHPVPTALPAPPPDWGPAYRATAEEVGLDPDVATGYRLAAAFLDPVLRDTAANDARWRPERGAWGSERAR